MRTEEGKVWRFGDHVDTDQIIPAERLVSENLGHMGDFIFEKVRPGAAARMKNGIIIAGKNFGSGSSREHAPRALLQAGIKCVIAESFARIFFRNSINVGLLLVECKVDTPEGSTVTVDPKNGTVKDDRGKTFGFQRYPEFIASLVSSGGLMAKIKAERGEQT